MVYMLTEKYNMLFFVHFPIDELKNEAMWKEEMDQQFENDAKYLAELRASRLSTENGFREDMYEREIALQLFDSVPAHSSKAVDTDEAASSAAAIPVESYTAELYDDINTDVSPFS